MNNLHRELAPVSDAAWEQIEEETTRTLKRYLAGRRVVDVPTPNGIGLPAVGTGHLLSIAPPAEDIPPPPRLADAPEGPEDPCRDIEEADIFPRSPAENSPGVPLRKVEGPRLAREPSIPPGPVAYTGIFTDPCRIASVEILFRFPSDPLGTPRPAESR